MNEKRFEEAKATLRDELKAKGYTMYSHNLPIEYKLRSEKLNCIDMINSLLCYSCRGYKKAKDVLEYDMNIAYCSYLKEYVDCLGEDTVLKLIQEQINDIARIDTDCFVDDEGLSYSSIIWKD